MSPDTQLDGDPVEALVGVRLVAGPHTATIPIDSKPGCWAEFERDADIGTGVPADLAAELLERDDFEPAETYHPYWAEKLPAAGPDLPEFGGERQPDGSIEVPGNGGSPREGVEAPADGKPVELQGAALPVEANAAEGGDETSQDAPADAGEDTGSTGERRTRTRR